MTTGPLRRSPMGSGERHAQREDCNLPLGLNDLELAIPYRRHAVYTSLDRKLACLVEEATRQSEEMMRTTRPICKFLYPEVILRTIKTIDINCCSPALLTEGSISQVLQSARLAFPDCSIYITSSTLKIDHLDTDHRNMSGAEILGAVDGSGLETAKLFLWFVQRPQTTPKRGHRG